MLKNKIKLITKGLLSVIFICSSFTLSACTENSENNASVNSSIDEVEVGQAVNDDIVQLSLMLDWYPNAVHTAIYTAKEKGYFEEAGIELEILMPADANDPLKLAAVGQVDVAINYQSQLLISRNQGIPVVSIASYVQKPLNEIMVKADSGIKTPKDLEGKRVGYASSEVTEKMVRAVVEYAGGNLDNTEFIDVGFDLIPALTLDRVDAIEGAYINHELLLMEKEGYEILTISHTEYGVPEMLELIIITGEDTLKSETKKDAIKRFLEALQRGQKDVVNNPKECLDILLNAENGESPLDEDIESESLNILIPLMGSEEKPFLSQNLNQYEAVIKWMIEQEIINDTVRAEDTFVNILTE
jgi:ABC-type nitrate/sulfonate/bicarbonate transport systems, periplasmic components